MRERKFNDSLEDKIINSKTSMKSMHNKITDQLLKIQFLFQPSKNSFTFCDYEFIEDCDSLQLIKVINEKGKRKGMKNKKF